MHYSRIEREQLQGIRRTVISQDRVYEKLTVAQLVKNIQPFMGRNSSLLCHREHGTGLYPEPYRSYLHPSTLFM